MRRPVALAVVPAALAAAAALAACGGRAPAAPSSTIPTRAPSTTPTAVSSTPSVASSPPPSTITPEPTVGPGVRLPSGAPTSFARDVPAAQVPLAALVPPRARISSSWRAPAGSSVDALTFAWASGADPLATRTGFEVWLRSPGLAPAWRVVYAFTDPPSSGVLDVRTAAVDVTGDGVPDALTFEDLGGSGGCGIWRVVRVERRGANEIYAQQTCDTQIHVVNGDLAVRTAVYGPGDAHCCPSGYRTTTLRWNGQGWAVVGRSTTPA